MGKIGMVAMCVGMGLASACARRDVAGTPPRSVEHQGYSATLVFPDDPAIAVADPLAPEFSRSDAALGPAGDVRAPADLWPSAAPSVDRVRYLYLLRSAETTVIFRQRLWWTRYEGAYLLR
jgi:hypothetical protein